MDTTAHSKQLRIVQLVCCSFSSAQPSIHRHIAMHANTTIAARSSRAWDGLVHNHAVHLVVQHIRLSGDEDQSPGCVAPCRPYGQADCQRNKAFRTVGLCSVACGLLRCCDTNWRYQDPWRPKCTGFTRYKHQHRT